MLYLMLLKCNAQNDVWFTLCVCVCVCVCGRGGEVIVRVCVYVCLEREEGECNCEKDFCVSVAWVRVFVLRALSNFTTFGEMVC